MASISNIIETYLKNTINKSKNGYVEIRRNELAGQFNCAPSQINYVLSTRFTINHGFVVESRRGGGGYIRVEKVFLKDDINWRENFCKMIEDDVSQQVAVSTLQRLLNEALITTREYRIMKNVVEKAVLKVELSCRDKLRADILKAMMMALLSSDN